MDFEFASGVSVWQAALLTAFSFAISVLGGFVGLSLATIRLPMMLFLGIPAPISGGTNIFVSGLASVAGVLEHLRAGRVNPRIVLILGIPACVGAFAGGLLSDIAPGGILILLAGLLIFWQGVEFMMMARDRIRVQEGEEPTLFRDELLGSPRNVTMRRVSAEAGIWLGLGMLGGAVGLILGRLPALTRILGVDPRIAAGTNLFIAVLIGASGWVGHVIRGQMDYPLLALMGAAAMVGSYYGAKLTGRVRLNGLLFAMGLVLMVVGALLVWQGIQSQR